MQDRTLQTPKSPADVDRIIESFQEFYERDLNEEERSILEYIRQLLIEKESLAQKAAAE